MVKLRIKTGVLGKTACLALSEVKKLLPICLKLTYLDDLSSLFTLYIDMNVKKTNCDCREGYVFNLFLDKQQFIHLSSVQHLQLQCPAVHQDIVTACNS